MYNPKPWRKVQRTGHPQVPAHLQTHPGPLFVFGYGPHFALLPRIASAGTTPSLAAATKRRNRALGAAGPPNPAQRLAAKRPGQFLVELAKYGLGLGLGRQREFFSEVRADEQGQLRLTPARARRGLCVPAF